MLRRSEPEIAPWSFRKLRAYESWQEITAQGFVGTRSLVSKWIRAHRTGLSTPQAGAGLPGCGCPARNILPGSSCVLQMRM